MRKHVILAVFALTLSCGAVHAQNIQTCGDLGTDNRPNWCARPNGSGGLTLGKSQCERLSDTQFRYTHCSGTPQRTYSGANQCCTQSTQCRGAFYVATCLN